MVSEGINEDVKYTDQVQGTHTLTYVKILTRSLSQDLWRSLCLKILHELQKVWQGLSRFVKILEDLGQCKIFEEPGKTC